MLQIFLLFLILCGLHLNAVDENPNTDVAPHETNHLAKVYKHKSAGEIPDLIKSFAPKNGAQLANTGKGTRLEDLRKYQEILIKHGIEHVEIVEAPMPALVINGLPFSSLPEPALLEILGKLGDTDAQDKLCCLYKQNNNSAQLLALANQGWKETQHYVAGGYARGEYGFTQDTNQLLDLANQGWEEAQNLVARGYAKGEFGFAQDPSQLIALANQGWKEAQGFVAQWYACGIYGFAPNPNQLLALANQGWKEARDLVAGGYACGIYGFAKDKNQLRTLANQGWEPAQDCVAVGYASGIFGFAQDPTQLLVLANQGWKDAQDCVADRYAYGNYGFTKDLKQLLALANQGWKKAQHLAAKRFARGVYEFAKDPHALRELAIKFRKNKSLFAIYSNTLPLKERIMCLLYTLGLDQHEQLIDKK